MPKSIVSWVLMSPTIKRGAPLAGWRRRGYQSRVSLVLALLAAILAVVYLHAAYALKVPQLVDPVGPRAFPYLLGTALLLCALGLLLEGLLSSVADDPARESFSWRDSRYLIAAGVMAWTLLYFLVFDVLGYFLATTLFLFALIQVFNGRRFWISLAVSAGFSALTFVLFDGYLDVFLPLGLLEGWT